MRRSLRRKLNRLAENVFGIDGSPGIVIADIGTLVVGDMHIGMEEKLGRQGIHFGSASERLGTDVMGLCSEFGLKRIVFLGDVKDSIGYPDRIEYDELGSFFGGIHGMDIRIAKGNHDGNIEKVLKVIGVEAEIGLEILIGRYAFMHGHTEPSVEAMQRRCLFAGHGHFGIRNGDLTEKAFIVAKIDKRSIGKAYERYDRNERLVMVPAFSPLITGTEVSRSLERHMPALRGIFNLRDSTIITTDGRRIKTARYLGAQG
jgi:metallophosphoesterase superfamily enzyme